MAAARGAVALRKSPARAVRAVSSTVCDDEETTGIFFSRQSSRSRAEIVSRGGRERTPIDGRSSIAIHRDPSIAMRVWIASHRIASSPSTRATTNTRRGDARDDKKAPSARETRGRANARTHLHGGGHDDVCMSAGRARATRMDEMRRAVGRFRRTRGYWSCEALQYGCVVDVRTVTVGWGRFMGERGCGIRAWEWMTKKESV